MDASYIKKALDEMIPAPKVELNYSKDYELLIATMLSAQSTDKTVNKVTSTLFLHSLEEINELSIKEIQNIIKPVGTYQKKAHFIKDITNRLITEKNKIVPNDRIFLESLSGVGRKTASVVLANLFNEQNFAVDTHVKRVSSILFITKSENVLKIEKDLETFFKDKNFNRINNQLILFGRYICTAKNPKCDSCLFLGNCKKTR